MLYNCVNTLQQRGTISGYSQPVNQPFLTLPDGQPMLAKTGDDRLQLNNEQLKDMGSEAAQISSALASCAVLGYWVRCRCLP
jgi:hypothetical protein